MNYKEFKELMNAEGLEESELVKFYLKEAGKCQNTQKS